MKYFTVHGGAGAIEDLDVGLGNDSRDLKNITTNHKETLEEWRTAVSTLLAQKGLPHLTPTINVFRNLMRNIFIIGSGLSSSKEVRDIFSSLVELVSEPCVAAGWSGSDVDIVFSAIIECYSSVAILKNRKKLQASCIKIIEAMKLCTICTLQKMRN
jgi:hypothetical protein